MGNSQLNDILGTRRTVVQLPIILANTAPFAATVEMVLLRATDNITIESVRAVWPTAITGADAHRKNFNICTRTTAYAGKSQKAAKDFANGTDAAINTSEELWAPTGTTGDMTSGMYLTIEVEHVGNGVICGSPTFIVDWRVQE
jgi:hypothetical protein